MLHNLMLPTYNQLMDRVVQFQKEFIAFICDAHTPPKPGLQDYSQAFQSDEIARWIESWMPRKMNGSNESYYQHLCKLLDYLRLHPDLRQNLSDAFDHDIAYFDALKRNNTCFIFFCMTQAKLKRRQEIRKLLDPFMIAFYEDLFTRGFSPVAAIDKKAFRDMFWAANPLTVCPACDGPRVDSPYEIDHFLPKALYPFLSMHPTNLIPICPQCNRREKGMKDPLDHMLQDPLMYTFHPFEKPALKEIKIRVYRDTVARECHVKIEEKDGSVSKRIKQLNALFGLERRWKDVLKEAIDTLIFTMQGQAGRKNASGISAEDIVYEVLQTILDGEDKKIGREPNYLVRRCYAYYAINDQDEKEIFLDMIWQALGIN